MKRAATIGALVVAVAVGMVPVKEALAADGGEAVSGEYGIYYGDGLRYLAERRYDAAVKALFRAYGMKPSAEVMELIVEAYDAMGHCDAVERQVEFLERQHAGARPVTERCGESGTLMVECAATGNDQIEVGRWRRARCGEVIAVPANAPHRVAWSDGGESTEVTVEAGQSKTVAFGAETKTAKVEPLPGIVAQVRRLPVGFDEGVEVPRLPASRIGGYRIRESDDGLYHIWAPRGGVAPAEKGAEVEMICPEDASDHANCVWVRERRDVEGNDGRGQFEIFVPRLD